LSLDLLRVVHIPHDGDFTMALPV